MHPALIAALATFGVQKLRGKSTSKSLKDALMAAGITYGVGEIGAGIEALGTSAGATGAGTTAGVGTGVTEGITSLGAQFGGTNAAANLGLGGTGISPTGTSLLSPEVYGIGQTFTPAATTSSLSPIAEGTREFLSSTGEFGQDISRAYQSGLAKFKALDPITQATIKYGTAPITTALFTPDELPEGMSQEEFMKLDEATRARLLSEQREKIKGLGSTTQPRYTPSNPYNYSSGNTLYTPFNKGGIVSVLRKFNEGGINYLPSKVTHDENDVNNYVRATGYVEDGSGNGDKDEDTILAQLADGEFVSRADAVLGAGIMAGASPSSMKDMRAKGAAYFYEQQKRFKRIFDLLDASRKVTTH
jgi:hypothetical protein